MASSSATCSTSTVSTRACRSWRVSARCSIGRRKSTTRVAAARLLVHQSAWAVDAGQSNTLHSAFSKAYAADKGMKVVTDAVQVFGGYGYMSEYPVEKLMRDAKIYQIYEGTSQIQREIIVRELFRKG